MERYFPEPLHILKYTDFSVTISHFVYANKNFILKDVHIITYNILSIQSILVSLKV